MRFLLFSVLVSVFLLCGAEGDSDSEKYRGFLQAAELGDAEAQHNLGFMYDFGEGIPEDNVQAVYWYTKASEQGYAIAQYRLGIMYNSGEGVAKDDVEAVSWFREAAEQGNAEAQYNLGIMYGKGEGVSKDYVEAYAWFDLSAANGDRLASVYRDKLKESLGPEQFHAGQQRAQVLRDMIGR